jgi:hypothetical protein
VHLAAVGRPEWLLWVGGFYMQLLWMGGLAVNYKWLFGTKSSLK